MFTIAQCLETSAHSACDYHCELRSTLLTKEDLKNTCVGIFAGIHLNKRRLMFSIAVKIALSFNFNWLSLDFLA